VFANFELNNISVARYGFWSTIMVLYA